MDKAGWWNILNIHKNSISLKEFECSNKGQKPNLPHCQRQEILQNKKKPQQNSNFTAENIFLCRISNPLFNILTDMADTWHSIIYLPKALF